MNKNELEKFAESLTVRVDELELEAADNYKFGLMMADKLAEVTAQRDELLAALKKIIVLLEGDDGTIGILDTTDGYYEWSIVTMDDRLKARAVIARAEGEQ